MPIKVECPNPKCRKWLEAPDTHAGKKARCPGCGHIITIPDPETVLVEAADPLIGAKLGVLEIKEKLGQGGMGAVYLGTNTTLDRLVAVKVLPEDLVRDNPTFLDRFLREAKMAAKLNHPNAVIVYSVGEEKGRHYIEMEFVQGMNLRQVIQKQKRVELKEASRIITDAARALGAAHKQGIIHRDIKPDNIMLTEEGQVKVTDFGLARIGAADSSITMSGQVMGTPLYMSPEQGQAKPTDARTDIYSLGATYYHALIGQPPFNADTPLQVMMKHVHEPVSWPDDAKDIPAEIRKIIEKMMAKDAADRYATCEELIKEIEEHFKPKVMVAKAITIAVPIQQAIPIAPPPKNAYVLSAQDLAAIESAGRQFRHPTPPKPKPKPAEPKAARPMPRWFLPAISVGVLIIVAAAIVIGIISRGEKKSATDEHGLTRIEEKKAGVQGVGPGVQGTKKGELPQTPTPKPETPSFDGVYVTEAATDEKIPHPLSRKTNTVRWMGEYIGIPEGMAFVPPGTFLMGKANSGEWDGFIQKEVMLEGYSIDKYEVTNAEYAEFVKATGHPAPWYWAGGKIPEGKGNHPVVYVNWEDATAYAEWCGKRLPTEAEWAKAAGWDMRKKYHNEYPWGDDYDPRRANHCYQLGCRCNGDGTIHAAWWEKWSKSEEGKKIIALGGNTAPVGQFKGDESFFKCFDMGGNVREWVNDWYREDYYMAGPGKNPPGPAEAEATLIDGKPFRVLRGGFWYYFRYYLRTSCCHNNAPTARDSLSGFRCALSLSDLEKWQRGETTKVAKKKEPPATAAPKPEPSGYDGMYVTQAATGEKIPHPLSRKTYKVKYKGEIYEVPEGMVFVPAGTFFMGKNEHKKETGFIRKEVYLDAYFIEKYEVTNAEYFQFVKATGHSMPDHWKENGEKIPEGRENHPVVFVTWDDAKAYCDWCGKRLPTEAEWEKAAGWDMAKNRQRTYPWGDVYDPQVANHCYQLGCRCEGEWQQHYSWMAKWHSSDEAKKMLQVGGNTAAAGQFRRDLSAFGCFDMGGNSVEWVSDWHQGDYYSSGPKENPKGPDQDRATLCQTGYYGGKPCRVMRGGNHQSSPSSLEAASRVDRAPSWAGVYSGFRCALSAADLEKWRNQKPEARSQKTEEDASRRGAESAEKEKPKLDTGNLKLESGEKTKSEAAHVSSIKDQVSKEKSSALSAGKSYDDVYVTQAATGDKIRHPLSRKTYKVKYKGEVYEVPEGMVFAPAGTFLMGKGDKPPEGPAHEVYLDAYFLGKYEVTNAEYLEFVKATTRAMPYHWKINGEKIPQGRENHPVVEVSWQDAKAYVDWSGKRLPTEAEWEKAAGWDAGDRKRRRYPWGDDYVPEFTNNCSRMGCVCGGNSEIHTTWVNRWGETPEGKKILSAGGNTASVGTFKTDRSHFGCFDMGGNVMEWVSDWYGADYYKASPDKNPPGPREDQISAEVRRRILRGGEWWYHSMNAQTYHREPMTPQTANRRWGFRCALSAAELDSWKSKGRSQKAKGKAEE